MSRPRRLRPSVISFATPSGIAPGERLAEPRPVGGPCREESDGQAGSGMRAAQLTAGRLLASAVRDLASTAVAPSKTAAAAMPHVAGSGSAIPK